MNRIAREMRDHAKYFPVILVSFKVIYVEANGIITEIPKRATTMILCLYVKTNLAH